MSEFSILTDESELLAKENRLDLRISTISFDRIPLVQIMGGREVTPSQVRTFCSVDFYNHDSKHSDANEGFEPIYNTLFSFKNVVDDFYLQHLEKEFIVVEVFGIPPLTADNRRPQGAIKLGTAKLPLLKIIEGDFSFQAQEIIHKSHEEGAQELRIGKLFFRMRMRQSIENALKWFNQNKIVKQGRTERDL